MRPQRTITKTASVTGFGYWSGRDVCVEFRPADVDTGIVFVRCDLATPVFIPALVGQRVEIPRRTTLMSSGESVEMVEHVLAACAGLRIDNCEIWVDSSEMPGCDGSSLAFTEALLDAGVTEQSMLRSQLVVTDVTRVGDEESWVEARPSREAKISLRYRLDYGRGAIGRQVFQCDLSPRVFCDELASARTFLLEEEANWLRSQGLGERVSCQDVLVFNDEGPIDNELRFDDECVRHKTLDLVGDLALTGCDIVGQIIAHRSGHRLNAELVRVLLAEGQMFTERRKSA